MSEGVVIDKLISGEQIEFVKLFDEYNRKLHGFAYGFVCDHDVANDIVQNVFIKIFERRHTLKSVTNIKSYLYSITKNNALLYLKNRGVEDKNNTLYAHALLFSDNVDMCDDAALFDQLQDMIEALPDRCREICKMRFYEGAKIIEIAEKIHLSENTVKVQIHRAVSKLKTQSKDGDMISFISFLLSL